MVQNVSQQTQGTEYGILIYDIPKENTQLYNKIQTKIRKRAVRLNLSVYLCLWGMREEIEKIIEEAQAETGQYATVFFAKFDNAEEAHIRRAAKESLIVEMKRISKRLVDSVRKAREKAEAEGKVFKHISEGYAWKITQRLEEAQALAMLFGLTRDIKYAVESVQKSFAAEMEKLLASKAEKKAAKAAAREAKKEEKKRKCREKQEAEEDNEEVVEESGIDMDDDLDTEEVETPDPEEEDSDEDDSEDIPDGEGVPSTSWTDPV